jgi:dihydrofolate reductase
LALGTGKGVSNEFLFGVKGLAMLVSLIAAMSKNRVIGRDNAIPWNIPADMSRFRDLTLGHAVIMGRKTFESIGKPLLGRKNIVVTRQPGYPATGISVAGSLNEAFLLAEGHGEVFICGGGEIYEQALPFAARIYITLVDCDIDGDTRFPSILLNDYSEISRERLTEVPAVDFIILERTVPADKASRG